MDDHYELNGIVFVWSRDKAKSNVVKHGITFEQAAEAFFDPFLKVTDASRNDEARDAVMGMDKGWNLLFVVHLILESEQIRIISARKATRSERRFYEI